MGDPEKPAPESTEEGEAKEEQAVAATEDRAKDRADAEAKAKAAVERARAEAAKKRAEAEKAKSAKSTTMVSAEAPRASSGPIHGADEIKAEPAKPTGAEVLAALGVDLKTLAASPTSTLVSGGEPSAPPAPPASKPATRAAPPANSGKQATGPVNEAVTLGLLATSDESTQTRPATKATPASKLEPAIEVPSATVPIATAKPVESVKFPPPAAAAKPMPPEVKIAREAIEPVAAVARGGARPTPGEELVAEKKATPSGIMKYGYAPFVVAAAVAGAAIVLWRVIVSLSGPG